ncbi:MAG: hypothetical protein ACKN9W_05060 [Methylococcus sp.]
MKILILFLIASAAQADEYYQAVTPYGLRDMYNPSLIQKGNVIYQTFPGTNLPNLSLPAYRIEGDTIYPAHAIGGMRDYSAGPGYRLSPPSGLPSLPGLPRLNLPDNE